MIRKPLQPPYTGPYRVLSRTPKYFTLDIKGRKDTVSVDRLNAVFCLDEEILVGSYAAVIYDQSWWVGLNDQNEDILIIGNEEITLKENINKINDMSDLELENRHNLLVNENMNLGINGGVNKEIVKIVKMNNELGRVECKQSDGKKRVKKILNASGMIVLLKTYGSN